MIVLECTYELPEAAKWKERLEKMTVPHQLILSSVEVPKLTEGKNETIGIEAIISFLDRYEKDLSTWNQDRCDMWFFDE